MKLTKEQAGRSANEDSIAMSGSIPMGNVRWVVVG
jgi:hypothetical protein